MEKFLDRTSPICSGEEISYLKDLACSVGRSRGGAADCTMTLCQACGTDLVALARLSRVGELVERSFVGGAWRVRNLVACGSHRSWSRKMSLLNLWTLSS